MISCLGAASSGLLPGVLALASTAALRHVPLVCSWRHASRRADPRALQCRFLPSSTPRRSIRTTPLVSNLDVRQGLFSLSKATQLFFLAVFLYRQQWSSLLRARSAASLLITSESCVPAAPYPQVLARRAFDSPRFSSRASQAELDDSLQATPTGAEALQRFLQEVSAAALPPAVQAALQAACKQQDYWLVVQ